MYTQWKIWSFQKVLRTENWLSHFFEFFSFLCTFALQTRHWNALLMSHYWLVSPIHKLLVCNAYRLFHMAFPMYYNQNERVALDWQKVSLLLLCPDKIWKIQFDYSGKSWNVMKVHITCYKATVKLEILLGSTYCQFFSLKYKLCIQVANHNATSRYFPNVNLHSIFECNKSRRILLGAASESTWSRCSTCQCCVLSTTTATITARLQAGPATGPATL